MISSPRGGGVHFVCSGKKCLRSLTLNMGSPEGDGIIKLLLTNLYIEKGDGCSGPTPSPDDGKSNGGMCSKEEKGKGVQGLQNRMG